MGTKLIDFIFGITNRLTLKIEILKQLLNMSKYARYVTLRANKINKSYFVFDLFGEFSFEKFEGRQTQIGTPLKQYDKFNIYKIDDKSWG